MSCVRILDGACPTLSMPSPAPEQMPPTWATAPYAGVVRALILAFKDADRVDMAPDLARLLARSIAQALAESPAVDEAIQCCHSVAIVPMPSRASTVRGRGRRHMEELVAEIERRGGPIPGLAHLPALRVSRTVRDQAGLDQQHRAVNLRRAMHVHPSYRDALRGAVCVLVDDVVTTGSTLSEAARAIEDSGVGPVVAATVAATVRRGRLSGSRHTQDFADPVSSVSSPG